MNTMDEYSTPLEQIRPELGNSDQSSINYADLLQTMETNPNGNMPNIQHPENSDQQLRQFPPPPIVQSMNNPHQQFNHSQQNFISDTKSNDVDDSTNSDNMSLLQKDFMFILLPSLLLYSSSFQNQIMKSIPSLFKEDRPTLIGNIFNASVIALIFVLIKNMKVQFN